MTQTLDRPSQTPTPALATPDTWLTRSVSSLARWRWEWFAWGALILAAALLRFWDLGSRALHHDESLHATYSWYLYVGRGYIHDPLMHGPLQFHGIAFFYFLFGAGDYSARMFAATFGTIVVALPFFLRQRLGNLGALLTAVMLAVSPSILYYSRFAREDVYVVAWTLLIFIGLWRYLDTRQNRYLYVLAGAIALDFAIKETTFITVALLSAYLFVTSVADPVANLLGRWFGRRPSPSPSRPTPEDGENGHLVEAASDGEVLPQRLAFFPRGLDLAPAFGLALLVGFALIYCLWIPDGVAKSPILSLLRAPIVLVGALLAGVLGALAAGPRFQRYLESAPVIRALAIVGTMAAPQFAAVVTLLVSTEQRTALEAVPGNVDNQAFGLTLALIAVAIAGSAVALYRRSTATAAGLLVGALVAAVGLRIILATTSPTALRFWPPDGVFYASALIVALMGMSAIIGDLLLGRRWWIAAAVFYSFYSVLFTTVSTNLPGFYTGIFKSLDYWLVQHDVQRGSQPFYYYLMMLPVEEFLPLVVSLIAAVRFLVRRNWLLVALVLIVALMLGATLVMGQSFFDQATRERQYVGLTACAGALAALAIAGARARKKEDATDAFLIYWAFGSLVAYSWAGEKMPWLTVHMALPLILLAGKALGGWIVAVPWRQLSRRSLLLLAASLPLALFALWRLAQVRSDLLQPADANQPDVRLMALLFLLVVFGFGAGLAIWTWTKLGWRNGLRVAGLVGVGLLFALSVRTAFQASYVYADTALDPLIYTQTTPDIPRIAKQIEELSLRTTGGHDLRITVDSHSAFSWPWAWYLRDYKNVDYPDLATGISGPPQGDVVLVHQNDLEAARPYLSDYTVGQRYRHRWWFPEDYRDYSPGKFFQDLVSLDNWAKWWNFFLYRTPTSVYGTDKSPTSALGSEDGYLFFRTSLLASGPLNSSGLSTAPNSASGSTGSGGTELQGKQISLAASQSIGSPGRELGQLNDPKNVAVDGQGNLWVADTGNSRVQKFSPDGRPQAMIGREGEGAGEFKQPWGLAFDAQGNLWVADTWNHRLQKFSPDGKFLLQVGKFGQGQDAANAQELLLYGPRAVVVAPDGSLWVADTGNRRVLHLNADGQIIGLIGSGSATGSGRGPGQLNEPVGLSVDTQGNLWVADTWNRRIQQFDATGRYLTEVTVPGWDNTGLTNKPYVIALSDGGALASEPDRHRLLRFDAGGQLVAVINHQGNDAAGFVRPTGLAADTQGNLYVADSGNGRIQKLSLTGGEAR